MELFFGLLPVGLMVFAFLALVGHAADAADATNDVDEDMETWLVSPGLVPWLPDYSHD